MHLFIKYEPFNNPREFDDAIRTIAPVLDSFDVFVRFGNDNHPVAEVTGNDAKAILYEMGKAGFNLIACAAA